MLSLQEQEGDGGKAAQDSPFGRKKESPPRCPRLLPPLPACLPNFQTGSLGGEADPIPAPSACLPAG